MIRNRLALLLSVLLVAGCTGNEAPTAPTPPMPPPAAQPGLSVSNWSGNSIVVSSEDGNACGGATVVGAATSNIEWRITTENAAILLEVDMASYPVDHMRYSGTLTGTGFGGSYATGSNYLDFFCELRGGTLSGNFSADFRSFDATETLIWGPPGEERTVERRWSGTKR